MTTYAEDLWGAIDLIHVHVTNEGSGLKKIIEFFQQIAAAEESYAKALVKSSQIPIDAKFAGNMGAALTSIRVSTKRIGLCHSKFAKDITENLINPLIKLQTELKITKKKLYNEAQRLSKDYLVGMNALEKAKQRQHKYARDAEQLYFKLQRAVQDPNQHHSVEQYKKAFEQMMREAKIAYMQYSEMTEQMRIYQKQYNKQTKSILDTFQNNDQQLLSITKAFMGYYVSLLEQMRIELERDTENTKLSVEAVDVQTLMTQFITKHRTEKKPDLDIEFDPIIPIYEREESHKNFLKKCLQELQHNQNKEYRTWFKNVLNPEYYLGHLKSTQKNEPLPTVPMKRKETPQNEPTSPQKDNEWEKQHKFGEWDDVDENMLNWFDEFITDLIQQHEVDNSKMEEALNFMMDLTGRKAFTMALNHHRSHCVLDAVAYRRIGDLIGNAMTQAHEANDAHVGRLLMNMTQTFFMEDPESKKQIYLQEYLKDHPIWKDPRFWESAFYDALSYERTKQFMGEKWKDLDESKQIELQIRHENIVFGQLGSFAFNMLNVGMSVDEVRKFVQKMCIINQLNDQYSSMLMGNIDATYLAVQMEKMESDNQSYSLRQNNSDSNQETEKTEESKPEEPKKEELKQEDQKREEEKTEELKEKQEDTKKEELKQGELKKEEIKTEEPKKEEIKSEELKKEINTLPEEVRTPSPEETEMIKDQIDRIELELQRRKIVSSTQKRMRTIDRLESHIQQSDSKLNLEKRRLVFLPNDEKVIKNYFE